MKKLLLLFLATGLMTACTKSEESQQQVEDQPVTGEEISYSTDNLTMNGYLAYDPDTEQAPGILVVHEWWGHNEHARNSAEKLAELGYVALAVDMYGEGKQAEHPDDAGSFASEVMSNFESAQARFTKAMEVLQNHPKVNPEHIGAIGYCFGGSVVISMANAGVEGLDAVAAFHAGLQLPVMPEEGTTNARILVMNGADDPFITEEQESALQNAMDETGADFEYITYEGVQHSFTNPAADSNGAKFELPLAYDAEADSMSWEQMKSFFDETFSSAES